MSESVLASRFLRLVATLVDATLTAMLTVVVFLCTRLLESAVVWADDMLFFLSVLAGGVIAYLILNGLLLIRRGQTIGKLFVGVTIVDNGTTEIASIPRLVVRSLFMPLTLIVVAIWIWSRMDVVALISVLLIFLPSRRCGHDYLSGTQVVQRQVARAATE